MHLVGNLAGRVLCNKDKHTLVLDCQIRGMEVVLYVESLRLNLGVDRIHKVARRYRNHLDHIQPLYGLVVRHLCQSPCRRRCQYRRIRQGTRH